MKTEKMEPRANVGRTNPQCEAFTSAAIERFEFGPERRAV